MVARTDCPFDQEDYDQDAFQSETQSPHHQEHVHYPILPVSTVGGKEYFNETFQILKKVKLQCTG